MDKTPTINKLVRSCHKQLQTYFGIYSGIPITHQYICTNKRNRNRRDMLVRASHTWFPLALSQCMSRLGLSLNIQIKTCISCQWLTRNPHKTILWIIINADADFKIYTVQLWVNCKGKIFAMGEWYSCIELALVANSGISSLGLVWFGLVWFVLHNDSWSQ